MRPQDMRSILATDCGSTTTKAILIERGPDGYRQSHADWLSAWGEFRFQPQELIDLSDRLLVLGQVRAEPGDHPPHLPGPQPPPKRTRNQPAHQKFVHM